MMPWRDRAPNTDKTLSLDSRFRPQLEAFLDALEAARIPFAMGDTRRDVVREWALWAIGRDCPPGANAKDPKAWDVVNAKAIVTRVQPGSGKGPHFWGLAADVYPLDETYRIMKSSNPNLAATLQRMWDIAEKLGIDALGHRTEEPGDEFASYDPCHFQALRWRGMVERREV